jgi:aminoglycoside 6'-N-acetyltransferase I
MTADVFMASPGHAALVERAHPDVFDATPRPDLVRSFLAAPHLHLALAVAEADGGRRVVGMCSGIVYHHPDKPQQWWINELGVASPWRRNRLATRLVAACADHARALDCTEIWVVADPTPMAEGFWQSLGWSRTGSRLAMFSRSL